MKLLTVLTITFATSLFAADNQYGDVLKLYDPSAADKSTLNNVFSSFISKVSLDLEESSSRRRIQFEEMSEFSNINIARLSVPGMPGSFFVSAATPFSVNALRPVDFSGMSMQQQDPAASAAGASDQAASQ